MEEWARERIAWLDSLYGRDDFVDNYAADREKLGITAPGPTDLNPDHTKWTVPDGGLFTWAQLPGGLNTTKLREEAITRPDVKVAFVAGEKFFTDGEPVTNCMRISFGAVTPENIEKATKKLGKMLCDELNK